MESCMNKKINLLLGLLLSFNVITSCTASGQLNNNQYSDDLINKVITEEKIGVKDRQAAIEFYKKKIKYVYLDKKGMMHGFSYSKEYLLTNDDIKYLVFFPEVEGIHFSGIEISDECFYYFQNMKNLSGISLIGTSVTGNGFKYLVDKIELDNFDLRNSPITDYGLKYLSEIKYKNPIIGLYLDNSKVTDAGMPYIAKMKFDQGRISLSGTAVTDEGIKHLAGFKNMIEIFLYNTKVTDKGGKWLEAQLPNTTVYWGKHVPNDDED
jgi:hypothetical protein